jgi:hypothetical protein
MGTMEEALLLKPPPVAVCRHAAAAAAEAEVCHHEGCPGCAMDRRKVGLRGKIPCRELFFVGATSLAAGKPISLSIDRNEQSRLLCCKSRTMHA